MNAVISVLLPVYNAAADGGAALRACMASLAAQCGTPDAPLPPVEILALNDGSSDASGMILDELARSWPGQNAPALRVVHLPHGGIAPTLNRGLELAEGTYIARMDADDSCHPQRLARQYACLNSDASLGVCATQVAFGGDPATAYGFSHFVQWQNALCTAEEIRDARFRDTPVCHPAVLFRRELAERLGAYRDGDFAEDWELWLRWLDAGVRFFKLPQALYQWNDPPQRLTRTDSRYGDTANNSLRAFWLRRECRRRAPRHIYVWGAGRMARRRLAPLWDDRLRPAAFIDIDPKKIGQRVRTVPGGPVPVIAPAALPAATDDSLLLNALTAHGAAEEAARWLEKHGWRQGRHWLLT